MRCDGIRQFDRVGYMTRDDRYTQSASRTRQPEIGPTTVIQNHMNVRQFSGGRAHSPNVRFSIAAEVKDGSLIP
jgi:hypothetical protein